jgi:hypothetical protein
MAREPRNIGASVRAKLLDRARTDKIDFQILLTRYALERLLYRLSVSDHRDRFILKGAMLFATWVEVPFRPTRDLDLLGHGDRDVQSIAATFRSICATPVADDGVTFDGAALQAAAIREIVDDGGVRVRTTAVIAGARIPIQVDIGFGDIITPGPLEIDYPTLLASPAPRLRAYPVETVVAEKFEALVLLGMANSRLKDFYDLWLIAQTFTLREESLRDAVRHTFAHRGSLVPHDVPVGLSDDFAAYWSPQWRTFMTRERMAAAPVALVTVLADLRNFLMPLTIQPLAERTWRPGGPWL